MESPSAVFRAARTRGVVGPVLGCLLVLSFAARGALAMTPGAPMAEPARIRAHRTVLEQYADWRAEARTRSAPHGATAEAARARIEDCLRKETALRTLAGITVTEAMVQSELDRIFGNPASGDRARQMLSRLDGDLGAFAEAVARPAVVDRLLRARAVGGVAPPTGSATPGFRPVWTPGTSPARSASDIPRIPSDFARRYWGVPARTAPKADALAAAPRCETAASSPRPVDWGAWWREHRREFPPAQTSVVPGGGFRFPDRPAGDPCADHWVPMVSPGVRYQNVSVMTDDGLFVWGGYCMDGMAWTYGVYEVATDAWTNFTVSADQPPPRCWATAVWSGSEILLFGGYDANYIYSAGARFNPHTGVWRPISSAGAPAPRFLHTAVWTGTEMVIWGGCDGTAYYQDGGRYDPATDTWRPLSSAGSPSPRVHASTVWTGHSLLVWGGYQGPPDATTNHATYYLQDGAKWDAASDTWRPMALSGAPAARGAALAVWTGKEMLVYGGGSSFWPLDASRALPEAPQSNGLLPLLMPIDGLVSRVDGARYAPGTDTWSPLATDGVSSGPHVTGCAVWTGQEMMVWGGFPDSSDSQGSGALYDPVQNTWRASPGGSPSGIWWGLDGYWLGDRALIWGAGNLGCLLYDPDPGQWSATGEYFRPVWGGYASYEDSGAELFAADRVLFAGEPWRSLMRYDYLLDEWVPMSLQGAPPVRGDSTHTWTGTELFLWSGVTGDPNDLPSREGGLYDPVTDTWRPTDTEEAPAGRDGGDAIWTGSTVVAWGGGGPENTPIVGADAPLFEDGGRYDVAADSWTWMRNTNDSHFNLFVEDGGRALVVYDSSFHHYDPVSDAWEAWVRPENSAEWKSGGTFLWDGSRAYCWSTLGSDSKPWILDPAAKTWTAISTAGAPANSHGPTAGLIPGGFVALTDPFNWPVRDAGRYSVGEQIWRWVWDAGSDLAIRAESVTVPLDGRLLIWGGTDEAGTVFHDGAFYLPPHLEPAVVGPSQSCGPALLGAQPSGSGYQWYRDGVLLPGETSTQLVASTSGSYRVQVTNDQGCTGLSAEHPLLVSAAPSPSVAGASQNACPQTGVPLSTGTYATYQWHREGLALPGATGGSYFATLAGNYSVTVTTEQGCQGTSASTPVQIVFCPASEVSPAGAVFPVRLTRESAAPTGYYAYFQPVGGAAGYNLYEGSLGNWYNHGVGTRLCGFTPEPVATGELRVSVTPSAGDHYYLVTAWSGAQEGPSGYSSDGAAIPASQSTCTP